jgi:hypothetical protein
VKYLLEGLKLAIQALLKKRLVFTVPQWTFPDSPFHIFACDWVYEITNFLAVPQSPSAAQTENVNASLTAGYKPVDRNITLFWRKNNNLRRTFDHSKKLRRLLVALWKQYNMCRAIRIPHRTRLSVFTHKADGKA